MTHHDLDDLALLEDLHTDPDLTLLRAAGSVAAPSASVLAAARASLQEAGAASRPTAAPGRRSARRWGTGAVAVAAAAALLLALPVLDSGPVRPADSASAAQVFLRAAATAAASRPEPDARTAAYWYVRSSTGGARAAQGEREVWIGRTGSGLLLTAGDDERVVLDGPGRFFGLAWDELLALPRQTAALRARVYALAGDAGSSPDAEAFAVVGDLLRESPAPPDLRAALLRVAATVPGVTLGERTRDSQGRPVVPVSVSDGAGTQTLLLDPQDGRLLGEEQRTGVRIVPPDGSAALEPGTLLFRSTLLAAGPVERAGQRP